MEEVVAVEKRENFVWGKGRGGQGAGGWAGIIVVVVDDD